MAHELSGNSLECGIERSEIDCSAYAERPEGFARRRESTVAPLCGMMQLAACGGVGRTNSVCDHPCAASCALPRSSSEPPHSRHLSSFVRIFAIAITLLTSTHAASLPEIYREAKTALEAGDAKRAATLLEPALAAGEGDEAQRTLASLALGLAYLRTDQAERAAPLFQQAATCWAGTSAAANALAPLGDAQRKTGKLDEAHQAYSQAKDANPSSTLGKYAQARLAELTGETLAAEKQYAKAADSFLSAADGLLALANDDPAYFADARALYTKVAERKEWRGEPTARAVFSMGEVERAQGHLPEALAYYQRTFASWVHYPHWCAQAYLRAAECMDKLGKRDFAIRHLREMLGKQEKFGALPEYQEAKKQLRSWGQKVE